MTAQTAVGIALHRNVLFGGMILLGAQLASAQGNPPSAREPGVRDGNPQFRGAVDGRGQDRGRGDQGRNVDGRRDLGRGDRVLQSSVIIGAPVSLQGGTSFGTVRDFVISDSGCIEYAVVNYENRMIPIPWGVANFDFGRRAFLVDISRDRIRDIPAFTNVAELRNAQFEQRVHTFYQGSGKGRMDQRGRDDNRGGNRPGVDQQHPQGQNHQPGADRNGATTPRNNNQPNPPATRNNSTQNNSNQNNSTLGRVRGEAGERGR